MGRETRAQQRGTGRLAGRDKPILVVSGELDFLIQNSLLLERRPRKSSAKNRAFRERRDSIRRHYWCGRAPGQFNNRTPRGINERAAVALTAMRGLIDGRA
jgi:hypothetical protein